ncbi:hypothetical protein Y032_0017g3181 [Ancylostoma ceylanicum]|uniref:Uncharacterized protein n=1 Tax=Ancylostoma ceylanicum TaxID=53326 RepID=A0A016V606_9BILA|nr:hypothetical protein Y032_0017g3181 [Ancylostoma ceylanicum]
MGNAGLSSRVYNDAEGKKRNFLIVRSLHTFEMNGDMYGAGTGRLHATCKGFVKGYAASPLDFNKLSDFKELLSKEQVNIVAIPGRKTGSKISNMDTCRKDPSFKQLRNQYHIDLPDGTQKIGERVQGYLLSQNRGCHEQNKREEIRLLLGTSHVNHYRTVERTHGMAPTFNVPSDDPKAKWRERFQKVLRTCNWQHIEGLMTKIE